MLIDPVSFCNYKSDCFSIGRQPRHADADLPVATKTDAEISVAWFFGDDNRPELWNVKSFRSQIVGVKLPDSDVAAERIVAPGGRVWDEVYHARFGDFFSSFRRFGQAHVAQFGDNRA